ncbi:MAG: SGNH/GDSL hydrolase family protein [Ruminococcaceae bacterium]|nr:SGNH/GDSL hydrolase family protein [Oscillospiraceae bacterium]
MKHTKKRLLAILLVLAMTLGMVPMLALYAGAEAPVIGDVVVGEDGAIADLGWSNGYIGSPVHSFGNSWKTVPLESSSYRYSDVVKIPNAGTTLVWSESTKAGAMSQNAMMLTSWTATDDGWVINKTGTNLTAQGKNTNSNQWYDEANEVIYYIYTTTEANEYLRFSCYGGQPDGSLAADAASCPKVYVFTPAFVEGETAGEGVVNVEWTNGFVGSYTNDYGAANATKIYSMGAGSDYNMSLPIIVPKAGTTLSFTEPAGQAKYSTEQAYAFSTWTVGADGRLDLFYGLCAGSENSACLTVDEDSDRHYAYTTSYDNEIVRVTVRGTATPVLSYKENNAENWAPALTAAGYDPAQAGKPVMLDWYSGLIGVESGALVLGSPMYAFSDIIPVYGKGTTITFTDYVYDAEIGVANFAADTVYAIAKFNGTNYTGVSGDSAALTELVEGVVTGDGAAAREEAFAAGKRVYTYTTTEDIEYLRLCYSAMGNEVNGARLAPIVYITAPGEGTYYNELEGLKLVTIGDSYFYGGGAHNDSVWGAKLAARYGMEFYNYGIDGSTVSNYVTTNSPMVDRYAGMTDGADIVIFEGGRNDYNKSVPLGEVGNTDTKTFLGAVQTMLAGLMEKYPNALIICVTPWNLVGLDETGLGSNKVNDAGLRTEDYANAFASYVESLNDDRVVAIRACDDDVIPVFMTNATFRKLYCVGANDISHLNDKGHDHVLTWFEQIIGKAYKNFGGVTAEGGEAVKFMNGTATVALLGTAAGDREITVPAAPAGVAASNIFGWSGVLTNGETSVYKIFRAGEKITLKQGDTGVFTPLTLEMKQIAEPELRMNDTIGLRFLATVSDAQYKALVALVESGEMGNATITVGMLIVPSQYVADMGGDLTHAALDEADMKRVDAVSEIDWLDENTLDWYKMEGDYGYVAGTVHEFLQQNHARKYTGRGYVKLTVENEEFYVYAENKTVGGSTIYEAAIKALNDCTPGPNETYQTRVEGENGVVYSRYTAEQRAALAEYVDDVLALETVTDQQTGSTSAELVHYDHYDPNSKRYNTVTLVNGGDDALSDIFYPYAGSPVGAAAMKDEAWDLLIAELGNDTNITSICAILVEEGYEITADGGILLDGFLCELDDATSSVKCAEFVYEGYTFYLLGFADYSNGFY